MILKPAALLAAIVSLTFAGFAYAADPVNIEIMAIEEEPGSMILTVSAVDEDGKPFPGLDPSSFNAWINDTSLIVKELHTSVDRQPASVLLLVDVSTSMAGDPIQQAQIAISEFIDVLEPDDEVAVMAFSGDVSLLQDFTSDRAALDAAVANFTLTDNTNLYDGVIEAAAKMSEVSRSRKLIVLLSDGIANINQEARDASIQAARDAGVGFIAVGLGANTDRDYLGDLTSASGGSLIEAATPQELRQAYTNLAFAIRSQYTLVTEVPRSIDRTVPGTLKVHVIHRADNAFAERALDPLEGAFPPPFSMTLDGIKAGDKHNGSVTVTPAVEEGVEVAKIDYYLDDELLTSTEGLNGFTLDASALENGSHVLKVVATDIEGREGEVQIPFLVPVLVAPSQGGGLPIIPIAIIALLLGVGFFAFKFGRKRWLEITTPTYSRVDTWAAIRMPVKGKKAEDWSDDDDQTEHPLARPASVAAPADVIQGRVVIMDEAAVRGGELETILEFDMKSLPLTFGSGPDADMRVDDAGGLIAAEEARIWVQRGRLVYHKLTTLSAMATEGVTAGWQFLDDGEEMRIGPYRIIFQTQRKEASSQETAPVPDRQPQEHGMALRRSFGLTEMDQNLDNWDDESELALSAESLAAMASPDAEPSSPEGSEEQPPAASSWDLDPSQPWAAAGSSPVSSEWDIPAPAEPGEVAQADRESDQAPAGPDAPGASTWDIAPGASDASGWEVGGSSEPVSSAWDSPKPGESAADASQDRDSGESAPSSPSGDDDTSVLPAEWGPTLLEPKSADWLVEQSQPIDSPTGQIVQPGAWGSFVSADADEASALSADEAEEDDAEEPGQRAWGT